MGGVGKRNSLGKCHEGGEGRIRSQHHEELYYRVRGVVCKVEAKVSVRGQTDLTSNCVALM